MEKLQIAKWALIQLTALVYSILICGAAVKITNMLWADYPWVPRPGAFGYALFMKNYGWFFFFCILVWTAVTAYYSSTLNPEGETPWLVKVALGFTLLLFLYSTLFSLGTVMTSMSGPPHLITGVAL